ncbi:MAG: hypothetical protein INH37_00620 [Myxococcaceae bacterium]|jgi:hypothetical protein|nr:hypothetical protein [Myxococcaceae bacterium]
MHIIRRYETFVLYRLLKQLLHVTATRRPAEAPTHEQRVDWAYGTAVIENPAVTREMVEAAAQAR